ncbi:HAD family hydrolase [Planococcus shenhongbingii]|uniref:HAD family hydrolase n=1 Tax=Planococcus shenhongbingii TaxID=3058398 RepID=A0ABT8NC10_9BACL|nr:MULTISPECIES: HAD family hydrolase [unclassified Planococcus (in: firmicutes)]MDN7245427.1 HAD family hydrolase [Planococcus sp. N017]WKA58523.1 HAD family hydrolase [Planococcus sp. N016]
MDSIIFDLDGTLWDSRETVVMAWNKAIEQNDKIDHTLTKQHLKETMGLQMHEIMQKLFPNLNAEMHTEIIQSCGEIEGEYISERGGVLYENLEDVLKALAEKYKLYIVSNCQEGYIEAFYEYHELEKYFEDFENPGRTGLSKGENIKLIMERNGLKDPVYVGDTAGDRKAAKDAGIPFVYAKYGFGEVEDYDYAIEKFDDLLEIF